MLFPASPTLICGIVFATADFYLFSSRVHNIALYLCYGTVKFFAGFDSLCRGTCVLRALSSPLLEPCRVCLSCCKVLKLKFNSVMFYRLIQKPLKMPSERFVLPLILGGWNQVEKKCKWGLFSSFLTWLAAFAWELIWFQISPGQDEIISSVSEEIIVAYHMWIVPTLLI